MPQAQIVDDRRPIQLRHPQRIARRLGRIGREAFPIAHLAHRAARTPQSPGDLAQAAPFSQPPPDLLVPMHRHAPKRHAAVSFVVAHEGCGRRGQDCGEEKAQGPENAALIAVAGKSAAQEARRAAIGPHPVSRVPLKPHIPGTSRHRRTTPITRARRPKKAPQVVPN